MKKIYTTLFFILITAFSLSGCSPSTNYAPSPSTYIDILNIQLGEDFSDSKLEQELQTALFLGENQFFSNYKDSSSLEKEILASIQTIINTNYLANCLLEEIQVNYTKVLGTVHTIFSLQYIDPQEIPSNIQIVNHSTDLSLFIDEQFQNSIEPIWILLQEEYTDDSNTLFNYMDNADSNASSLTCEAQEFYINAFDSDGEQTLLHIGRTFPVAESLLIESQEKLKIAIKEHSASLDVDATKPKEAYEEIARYVMENAYYDDNNANYILNNTEPSDPEVYLQRTAYGVFIAGRTICTGYAKAFKALCDEIGLPCRIVFGEMQGIPHAWNAVKLDNEIFYIDVTTADTGTSFSNAMWLTEVDLENALYYLSASAELIW